MFIYCGMKTGATEYKKSVIDATKNFSSVANIMKL